MIVAPGVNGWSEELDRRLPHDPEGAKALLAEAGYPDGFARTLALPALAGAGLPGGRGPARSGRHPRRSPMSVRPTSSSPCKDAEVAGFWLDFVGTALRLPVHLPPVLP